MLARVAITGRKVQVDLVDAVRRGGVHDRVVQLRLLERGPDRPPFGSRAELRDRGLEPDLGVELARERVGELLQAGTERDHPAGHRRSRRVGVTLSRAHHAAERLDDRAVGALEPVQLRERMANRELLGIAGVDAGDERVRNVVHDLLVEPAADEGGDALLDRGVAAVDERLTEYRQLGPVGEQPRREEVLGRHRERQQPVLANDVALLGGR
jgi:hypothetical protein